MVKLPKGSSLQVQKTSGLQPGNYDLYDIKGLTLGKLKCIQSALGFYQANFSSVLVDEIMAAIGEIDVHQTINGK